MRSSTRSARVRREKNRSPRGTEVCAAHVASCSGRPEGEILREELARRPAEPLLTIIYFLQRERILTSKYFIESAFSANDSPANTHSSVAIRLLRQKIESEFRQNRSCFAGEAHEVPRLILSWSRVKIA